MFESGIVFLNLVSFEFPASHCFQKRKDSHRSTFATTPYDDDPVIYWTEMLSVFVVERAGAV